MYLFNSFFFIVDTTEELKRHDKNIFISSKQLAINFAIMTYKSTNKSTSKSTKNKSLQRLISR